MLGADVLAIHEPTYRALAEVLELRKRGRTFTLEEAAGHAGLVARAPAPSRQAAGAGGGMVAVLPLIGFMSHRGGLFSLLFGGTSTAALTADVQRAAADPTVSGLLIVVDSPGGEVAGVEELAAAIADAATVKRVTAVVDGLGASAAYHAISAASEIVASPSALLGSLGVMAIHDDVSGALAEAGIKRTIVTSSRFKAEGNSAEPLGAEARAELQRQVDSFDAMMIARIAAGRRVPVDRVRADFGQGRIVMAAEAVRRGMADRVGTMADALAGLARPAGMQASAPGRLVASPEDVEVRRRRLRLATSDLELLRLRARFLEQQ
jgi:signal peptide peptidase SppA